jgi:hypothetical protein
LGSSSVAWQDRRKSQEERFTALVKKAIEDANEGVEKRIVGKEVAAAEASTSSSSKPKSRNLKSQDRQE